MTDKSFFFDTSKKQILLHAPGEGEESSGNESGGGMGAGFWGSVIQGVGSLVGGVGNVAAANIAANTDDVCGKKPGIFKYKGQVKDDYNACIKSAREARLNAINADAEATRNKSNQQKEKNKWLIPVMIIVVITMLITTLVLIRRGRKK